VEKNITGVWKGDFYVDSTKQHYPFEVTISEENGKYTGYSRIAFEENGKKHVVFRDHKIKVNDNSIIIEDDNQLDKASSISQPKEVKKTMLLNLTGTDTSLHLNGTWSTNRTKRFLAATGSVQLHRKVDFRETEIYKKLDELALADKLSFTRLPEPEVQLKLDRILLTDLTTVTIQVKKILPPAVVAKPNPSIRPKDILFAKVEKEVVPVVKPKTEPVVAVKKPVPAAIKPPSAVVAKVEKPAPKPAPVKEVKPAVAVVPVVRKNIPPPVIANAAVDVSKRTISNEQALFYKSDSLQITLYDNGEIDGDTVSVLLNGKVIIAKKGLDTKPNSYTIYFDSNTPDSQMLVMYAENLGSIPPNTGLLVVREGKSVYELRFSADLKTNAAIILRRKKED